MLVDGLLETAVRDRLLTRRGDRWHFSADAGFAVPEGYADTVSRRPFLVDDAAARVLRAASVFGSSFPWSLLGEMTSLGDDAVLVGLRSAIEVGQIVADGDGLFSAMR